MPSRRTPPAGLGSPQRLPYLDRLKALLIAAIIAGHAVAGYSDLPWWPYSEMKEVGLSDLTHTIVYVTAAPASLVLIPLLFLVAGLLTPRSLARKGPGRYVRDRLLRLGVPFAAFVLVLWPLLMYPVHPPGEVPVSYWREFTQGEERSLDSGPLWFVGVLLLLSLAYAAWVRLRGGGEGAGAGGRAAGAHGILARHLAALAAAVALTTFLVRLLVPLGGSNYVVGLNVWEWPACVALFVLGLMAARDGWATRVPPALTRRCRAATLAALLGFGAFVGLATAFDVDQDRLWGGWDWAALVFAALESALAVFGAVWVLGVAQRRLNAPLRGWMARVGRSAYGAFMLQGPVLLGVAAALRPVSLPAEVKALLVAVLGVAVAFAAAWLLVRRVPGVARVL